MTTSQAAQAASWPLDLPVQTFVWPAEQPRASLLLAHGFGEYSERYARLIRQLNTAGYSVYGYDHRGHGRSQGRRAVVDVRQLVQDHIAARAALAGVVQGPLFAFGHSLGGLVTAASLLQDPRGVAGAVLSSPALLVGVNEPAWLKQVGRVLARIAPGMAITELPTAGLSRLAEEVSAYEQDPQMYHGRVPALTAISMLRVSEGLWPGVSRWRLPTLIVHGDADQLTDVNGSRRFYAGISSLDKTYHEEPGGYHELFNDTVRDDITARLLGWLDAHTA
ncbi:lysophospholipase [Deinococcus sonorensis]|uniref:Lysophospholipase n=2 Tax=Deinococcus sonorensis TaxID=309891 RepID=A0AAU7UB30_9DEIO